MGDGGEKKVKSQKTERSRKMDGMEMYSGLMARFFRCLLPSSVNNKNPNTLHPHSVYSIPDSRSPHINTSSTCRFVLNEDVFLTQTM